MSSSGYMSAQELQSALAQIQLMLGEQTDPALAGKMVHAARYAPLALAPSLRNKEEKHEDVPTPSTLEEETLQQMLSAPCCVPYAFGE